VGITWLIRSFRRFVSNQTQVNLCTILLFNKKRLLMYIVVVVVADDRQMYDETLTDEELHRVYSGGLAHDANVELAPKPKTPIGCKLF
jgi:hypothetical protein